MSNADKFYVYTLTDPRNDAVFYIGKGKRLRAWVHGKGRSHSASVNARVTEIKASGHSVKTGIVAYYDTELEAIDHECELIVATPNILNVLARGWALTPEQAKLRLLGRKEQDFMRLGPVYRDKFARKVAYFNKFDVIGLAGIANDTWSTKVVKDACSYAQECIDRWDAYSGKATA